MTPSLLRELANVFETEALEAALGCSGDTYYGVRSSISVGRRSDFNEADRLEAIADELRARAQKRTGT